MTPLRIFISSVQGEFAREREALRDYVRGDPLMRRCFEVFLFEDVPATDRRPDDLYLDEVERCDLYVGLFGKDYGAEDGTGTSPTEREFDRATVLGKHRLIFLKTVDSGAQHPRMRALIAKAQGGLIRKQFGTAAELLGGLYAALVEFLEGKELLRFGPFDAAPCFEAEMDDLDVARMTEFIRTARKIRQFPLDEHTSPEDLLGHLNLLNKGRLTNAAVLLFAKEPQKFLISSEIKCAHYHGTMVAKPIPSYQVYKGTVFDLVDQAVDFVLSKIALSVGTAGGERAGSDSLRNSEGGSDRSDRQRRSPPRLHGQQQHSGNVVRGPTGCHEFRSVAAAAYGGEVACRPPVLAWQSFAGGIHVPAGVYRTNRNRDGGYDSTLRRGWRTGTGVRCQRKFRHNDSTS